MLCTAHIACALGAAVNAFKTVTTTTELLVETWTSPLGTWTNVQQLVYTINVRSYPTVMPSVLIGLQRILLVIRSW
jgi:hypothetical protein